ncbi:MAG: sensor domain-containing diguanylate cyclase [Sideroxyarcus sp.]|nr:sensor domain-containing diguanylate cyclase [Sideroxyarcus sp.]
MNLKARFLLLMTLIFIGFLSATWFLSDRLMSELDRQWGEQFAERQVMFDKYRTLAPLIREIALARQMAAEPAIVDMALHEHDPELRRRGIAAMEKYRFNFRDHSYFAAFARSGNYYYNDAAGQYAGKQLRYMLSPTAPADKWFYATLVDGKEYQVNLDPDVHLKVTKAWINVLVRSGSETLGIVGTGIDLTDLINETVKVTQPGVHNMFIDKSMAIQLNSNPELIDYMTVAKDVGQRIKIDVLLKNPADIDRLRQAMIGLERSPGGIATLKVDYMGGKHLLGVAFLPEIGWYDLTLMDGHSLSLFDDLLAGPFLFGLALLLALMAVGWALRAWILKPIAALRASTDKIRNGNFEVDPHLAGPGEIAHLSRSFESMARFVLDSNRHLEERVRERTEELRRLSEIDPLTGLLNRRGMLERFEGEIARQARQGGMMGILLLDLDHFKNINDTHGHAAGDLALCETAKVLQSMKRPYDHASRWGGEEFLMLMPDCPKADLLGIAERIREKIAALRIQAGASIFDFTVSIGAYHPDTPQTLDTMLQKVDGALYAAKDGGRNCVRLME